LAVKVYFVTLGKNLLLAQRFFALFSFCEASASRRIASAHLP